MMHNLSTTDPLGVIMENTTGITDVSKEVADTVPNIKVTTLATVIVLSAFVVIFASLVFCLKQNGDYSGIESAVLSIGAIATTLMLGTTLLFAFTVSRTESSTHSVVENIHREILVDNHFDMDNYKSEEISDFKDSGKMIRWKDTRTGEVVFATRHQDSSNLNSIKIAVLSHNRVEDFKK